MNDIIVRCYRCLPAWLQRLVLPTEPWRVPIWAFLLAVITIILCAYLDTPWGDSAISSGDGWRRFVSTTLLGVSCSVGASAAYVLLDNVVKLAVHRMGVRKFLRLFSAPGVDGMPPCYVVVQHRDTLPYVDPSGKLWQIDVPLSLVWADDVKCATSLQAMVLAIGGNCPSVVSPMEAKKIRERLDGPAIFFTVGLNSNDFSALVCQGDVAVQQNLLRIMQDAEGCYIDIAKPVASGIYDVAVASDRIRVPKTPVTSDAILMRVQDATSAGVTYVVAGGCYSVGTVSLGRYLSGRWQELAGEGDTSIRQRCVSDHSYLVRFEFGDGGVADKKAVRVGGKLVAVP